MGAARKQPLDFTADLGQPAQWNDQRGDQRVSLMMRTAKLLSGAGEYVCIIRDVSAEGVRLQLFHALPDHNDLRLELGNGDSHAIEFIWQTEAQAGFRFHTPVDLNRFIAEPEAWPRRPLRIKLRRPAIVIAHGLASPATLLDISQNGAKIDTVGYFTLSQSLLLEINGMQRRSASVRWHRGGVHGLMFEHPLRLDELAHFAMQAHPLMPAKTAPKTRSLWSRIFGP